VFATAPFLYLLITSPWQLVLVRIYHGLATAILGPVALASVADTYETGRGERMGWYSSATMIGRFLAPLIGGILIFGDNFRWVYIASGVAGVLTLVAAFRLPGAATSRGSVREASRGRRANTGRKWYLSCATSGFSRPVSLKLRNISPTGYRDVFAHLSERKTRLSGLEDWCFIHGADTGGRFHQAANGRLSDRYGRVPMIVAGLALGGVTTV